MRAARGWLARQRASLVIAAGFVAALLVVLVLGTGGPRTSEPLDPDNPGPAGAQALARVLDDRGVDVTVARGADALDDTPAGPGTTVLVTSTEQLGDGTIERLLAHTGDAQLVLAAPGPATTEAFGVTDPPYAVAVPSPRAANCDDPRLAGLSVAVDQALEYPQTDGGCFGGQHGALVVEPRPGIVLLGAAEVLTNDQVLRADNAAAALRLLGQGDRLVWYVPSLDDLLADDAVSVASLLPRWLRPGLWLGTVAVLALIAWRARRLGPLATEPLSVVVK
ncbi:MAG: secreted protein, partial [Actinomycetia bacterium]|nr:secreted protein [Actinomycetes bacterium]